MYLTRQPLSLSCRFVTAQRIAQHYYATMSSRDQYTAAAGANPDLSKKLGDLRAFLGKHRTVMLVTRAPDGALHARTMAPAEITPDWKFRFLYDRDSYKDNEIENE